MNYSHEGWMNVYRGKGAFLENASENPDESHPLLTGGLHSSGFFNSRLVLSDEIIRCHAASDLCDLLLALPGGKIALFNATCVVGPKTGGVELAKALAKEISQRYGVYCCSWASPAKQGEGSDKRMVFDGSSKKPSPEDRVLLCDDVLSTGGSIELTDQAVRDCGAAILPFILTMVNRSNIVMLRGKNMVSLIHRPMPAWTQDECPLCMKGSVAIPAKDSRNWARLKC